MEVPFVDLKGQYRNIRQEIDQAVQSVIDTGQFIGGKFVRQFENSFATGLGVAHCVAVGNGTDAILIALKSLGVMPGDEVITPVFGWISASEMITLAGAKPVFADVLPETYTIDPARIEANITPRTKGIVIIHLYGQAAHAGELKRICEKHKLFLIEDCAQAHMTQEYGMSAGTIGDAGTFSFYPTKNLGAYGDAGCIVTGQNPLQEMMRLYANHGGLPRHTVEGINSRLDPLQAAILTTKLSHLSRWTQRRIDLAKQYDQRLADVNQITRPAVRPDTRHTFHQYVIRTTFRNELKAFLEEDQIQTVIHYPSALHRLPAYRYLNYSAQEFPVAGKLEGEVLSLPIYPELSEDQVSFVAERIKAFFSQTRK